MPANMINLECRIRNQMSFASYVFILAILKKLTKLRLAYINKLNNN